MHRDGKTSVTHYFIPYKYKIYGYILAFLLVFVVIPIIAPFINRFDEQFQQKVTEEQVQIIARIERGEVDEKFGDVSEFVTPDTCYSQLRKYEGKIVSFTGRINYFLDTGAQVLVNIDSDLLPLKEAYPNRQMTTCYANVTSESITQTELEPLCENGDKVLVIGQVCGADYNEIRLQHCRIESYNSQYQ